MAWHASSSAEASPQEAERWAAVMAELERGKLEMASLRSQQRRGTQLQERYLQVQEQLCAELMWRRKNHDGKAAREVRGHTPASARPRGGAVGSSTETEVGAASRLFLASARQAHLAPRAVSARRRFQTEEDPEHAVSTSEAAEPSRSRSAAALVGETAPVDRGLEAGCDHVAAAAGGQLPDSEDAAACGTKSQSTVPEVHGSTSGASGSWRRYRDEWGRPWWQDEATAMCFWEGDSAWTLYRDPDSGKRYWFHSDEQCFYID